MHAVYNYSGFVDLVTGSRQSQTPVDPYGNDVKGSRDSEPPGEAENPNTASVEES